MHRRERAARNALSIAITPVCGRKSTNAKRSPSARPSWKISLKYLLTNEDYIRSMKNFEFMGSPVERINLLKSDLKKLEE